MHLPRRRRRPILPAREKFHDLCIGCRSATNGGEACVRAMILAAGLGTRMRPLTDERAKPALPVRGRPVVSLLLELLARQGIREVLINLHHLPDSIRRAVEADHPAALEISWSNEEKPHPHAASRRVCHAPCHRQPPT